MIGIRIYGALIQQSIMVYKEVNIRLLCEMLTGVVLGTDYLWHKNPHLQTGQNITIFASLHGRCTKCCFTKKMCLHHQKTTNDNIEENIISILSFDAMLFDSY